MRSLRYLNSVLTVLAVLLALVLWTTWNTSSVTLATPPEAAAQDVFNPVTQHKELMEVLNKISQQNEALMELFRSGEVRVQVVTPRLISSSEGAKGASLLSQLQTVRSQLELYQVQHNGKYPALATLWTQLTTKTNAKGAADAQGVGPYLYKASINPFTASVSNTRVSATGTTKGDAWAYNAATGEIMPVLTAAQAVHAQLKTGQYVTAATE